MAQRVSVSPHFALILHVFGGSIFSTLTLGVSRRDILLINKMTQRACVSLHFAYISGVFEGAIFSTPTLGVASRSSFCRSTKWLKEFSSFCINFDLRGSIFFKPNFGGG